MEGLAVIDKTDETGFGSSKNFFDKWGFYISKGCYWYTEFKGRKMNEIRISNFEMKILYHLNDSSNNTRRIIKIQRENGEVHLKEVYSGEMSNDKFEVILKSTGCTFKGNAFQLKSIFEYLMQSEVSARAVENLGYQDEFGIYAFADAIINDRNQVLRADNLGIVRDKDKFYYLPAFSGSNIDNDFYSFERNYAYKAGDIDFTSWAGLVYQTFGINGAIGISYVIACLFRDIIFTELRFFPFVFLFGQYGTGKTSFIESILSLLGSFTIGTDLSNVTTSGLSRETSQRINSVFYFKEFTIKNAEIANPFILNAYDGSGRTIGEKTTTNKTKKFLPQSGAFFDGNYLPIQKDAVFSRLIVLKFEENNFSAIQKEFFNTLKEQKEKGLSQIVKEILQHRRHFEARLRQVFKKHLRDLDNMTEYNAIQSRLKNHTALLISVYDVMSEVICFPFGAHELIRSVISYMESQYEMLEEIKDITNFWKAAETSANKGLLVEGKDYVKEKSSIFIKYDPLYTSYLRYCNENQLNKVDKTSLKELLTAKSNRSFIPNTQKSRKSKATMKYGFGSCYEFSITEHPDGLLIDRLEIKL